MRLPVLGDDFVDEQPPPHDFSEISEQPQWRSERQARQAALEKRNLLTSRFDPNI